MPKRLSNPIPAVSAALLLGAAAAAAQEVPPLSTFSIVACDSAQGFWGVGVQSRVVGAGSIVPAAEAGVGAIASQASANVAYKRQALELLRQGLSPEEIREQFVSTDEGRANRQFAIVDAQCRLAAFTGDSTLAWAGHRQGPNYSVQGNILAGPQVVEAMAAAYERAEAEGWPFGERILAALKAGQDAGGDTRGRQGAGLLIVKDQGGYGGGDDRYADLRVEDHVEPILELERVYNTWMSVFHPADHFLPGGRQPVTAPAGAHICELRRLLTIAGYDDWQGRGGCVFDDVVIGALKRFQREAGLSERAAITTEAVQALRSRVGDGTRR